MYQVSLFCLDLSLSKKRPDTNSFILEGNEIRHIQNTLKEQSIDNQGSIKMSGSFKLLEGHAGCLNACEHKVLLVPRTAAKTYGVFGNGEVLL